MGYKVSQQKNKKSKVSPRKQMAMSKSKRALSKAKKTNKTYKAK